MEKASFVVARGRGGARDRMKREEERREGEREARTKNEETKATGKD
jgi:hypothetical protein